MRRCAALCGVDAGCGECRDCASKLFHVEQSVNAMADGDRKAMTLEDWRSVVQVRWPPDRQPVDADRPETAVEHSRRIDRLIRGHNYGDC